MDRMLRVIVASDLATPLGCILLGAMPANHTAANLIYPSLSIGVWGRMNILACDSRSPQNPEERPSVDPPDTAGW